MSSVASIHRQVPVLGAELAPGDVLAGRYRIVDELGVGGIGIVYRAVQLPLERPVAIKVMHDDLLALPELRARFEREARVLSALVHPHIVSISDYGIDGQRPFLVMELLDGVTLDVVIKESAPVEPARAITIVRQVLKGLAAAHEKKVAHRDLKPANVFLTRVAGGTEHVKLLDFGLATMLSPSDAGEVSEDVELTQRGVVFGTPAYMSPEQATGARADVRSDVYSAGVLLFELLAGRRPFVADTRAELLADHLTSPVPPIGSARAELRVHQDLAAVIDRAMAKSPRKRFADAGAMLAAIDAIEGPLAWLIDLNASDAPTQRNLRAVERRPPRTPRGRLAVGLAIGLAIGVGLTGWWQLRSSGSVTRPEPVRAALSAPTPSSTVLSPLRDPFAEPVPEPLEPFVEMVRSGRQFEDRSEVGPLYALSREMPDDPRPLLLLGHLFIGRGWYTEGMRRYRRALEMDPSVRGDPRVLEALTALASHREPVGETAAELLREFYGAEALPYVQSEIDALERQPMGQLRLVRLRDSLR